MAVFSQKKQKPYRCLPISHQAHETMGSMHFVVITTIVTFMTLWAPLKATAQEGSSPSVTIICSSGEIVKGKLTSLNSKSISVSDDATVPPARRDVKISLIREIALASRPAKPEGFMIGLLNGSYLLVDTISTDDSKALLTIENSVLELPQSLIYWAGFQKTKSGTLNASEWLAELPDNPAADIVVVKRDDSWQFIECAISEVTQEDIIVLLDGETIPVSRKKIAGICWLRPGKRPGEEIEPSPQEILLTSPRGIIRCRQINWNETQRCWDIAIASTKGDVTTFLPADALSSIDYSFGRLIDLTRQTPANSQTDPYFGGLAKDPTLLEYFAPRRISITGGDDQDRLIPALLTHPRTEITWSIPADSSRFQASFSPAKNSMSPTVIVIQVDNTEVFQGVIGTSVKAGKSAGPLAVNLPLAGGTQLKIIVDFLKKPLHTANGKTSVSLLSGPIQIEKPRIER
ncbi:MAG: hypothetical protein HN985_02065 [Planctomycetaceae bacterium]|nr:hypothetical protein [Planctomycetaceae bacterium]